MGMVPFIGSLSRKAVPGRQYDPLNHVNVFEVELRFVG